MGPSTVIHHISKGTVMRSLDPNLKIMMLDLLADEFGAQHQYQVHEVIARALRLVRLADVQKEHYDDEVKHSEMLIKFMLSMGVVFDGTQGLCEIRTEVIPAMESDYEGEQTAELKYIRATLQAVKVGDHAAVELLQSIIKDERDHIDDFFGVTSDLSIMGEANFLASLV